MQPARVKQVVMLVALVALALYAGVLSWQVEHLKSKELKARAAWQGKTLVDSGWLKGVEDTQKALAEQVPLLQKELAAAKTAKSTVAGSSHWEGAGGSVSVPCTVVMGSPTGTDEPRPPGSPSVAGVSETPPSVHVTPHVRIDDAVALDDAGGIYIARAVQARLSVGDSWTSLWEDVEPDLANVKPKVAPEIAKAWSAYKNPPPRVAVLPRPWRQWRAGWSFGLGGGVTATGEAAAGVFAVWGPQF